MPREMAIQIGSENDALRDTLRELAQAVFAVQEYERGIGRTPPKNSKLHRDQDNALRAAMDLLADTGGVYAAG